MELQRGVRVRGNTVSKNPRMMEGEIISVLDNTVIVVTEKKENVVMRKGALELIEG